MCMFGAKPPGAPAPPPPPPTDVDASVQTARDDQKKRARAAAGYSSTITTGPLGDQSAASTGLKSLTGQ